MPELWLEVGPDREDMAEVGRVSRVQRVSLVRTLDCGEEGLELKGMMKACLQRGRDRPRRPTDGRFASEGGSTKRALTRLFFRGI